MAHPITLTLSEPAAAAFMTLRNAGLDPDGVVEAALVQRAAHIVERAEEAAHLREQSVQQTELGRARELPPQIEFLQPPR